VTGLLNREVSFFIIGAEEKKSKQSTGNCSCNKRQGYGDIVQSFEPHGIPPEVIHHQHRGIIDEMKKDRDPQVTGIEKQIAQQGTQKKPWQKTIKLKVNQAEYQ
jgi:hypothetical protein